VATPTGDPGTGQRFSKQDRIVRRSDFLAAQSQGRRVHTPHFILLLRDRGDGGAPRLGITTSRKVASAVGRNRVRRLVREVFRTHKPAFPAGHDCVVIAREKLPALTLAEVRDEILGALAKRSRRPSPPGAPASADAKQPHASPPPGPPGRRPR
jgi:ribonuclease P protein component